MKATRDPESKKDPWILACAGMTISAMLIVSAAMPSATKGNTRFGGCGLPIAIEGRGRLAS
ncbi:MAG: hypothetical protein AB7G75_23300 [Candidatus Binatia bacterium]